MIKNIVYIFLILGISFFCGCEEYKNRLFVYQISKSQVDIIKNMVVEEGFKKDGPEDFRGQGAFSTWYIKELYFGEQKYQLLVTLSFKKTKNKPDVYRSLGIRFSEPNYKKAKDNLSVRNEIERMERLFYNKLLEFVPKEYIMVGWTNQPIPEGLEEIDE